MELGKFGLAALEKGVGSKTRGFNKILLRFDLGGSLSEVGGWFNGSSARVND